jgi:hypothetical protein
MLNIRFRITVSNISGEKLLNLQHIKFEISAPQCLTHYSPAGNGNVLVIVVHRNFQLSEVIVSDILDSDHLLMFSTWCIMLEVGIFRTRLTKFTDWERFQSLASELISPRIKINSEEEAYIASRDFIASIPSTCRLSTSKITLSDLNKESLLKHKRRSRKLWQVTRDPTCKTVVNRVAKLVRRMTHRKALERWETKVGNYEVTP